MTPGETAQLLAGATIPEFDPAQLVGNLLILLFILAAIGVASILFLRSTVKLVHGLIVHRAASPFDAIVFGLGAAALIALGFGGWLAGSEERELVAVVEEAMEVSILEDSQFDEVFGLYHVSAGRSRACGSARISINVEDWRTTDVRTTSGAMSMPHVVARDADALETAGWQVERYVDGDSALLRDRPDGWSFVAVRGNAVLRLSPQLSGYAYSAERLDCVGTPSLESEDRREVSDFTLLPTDLAESQILAESLVDDLLPLPTRSTASSALERGFGTSELCAVAIAAMRGPHIRERGVPTVLVGAPLALEADGWVVARHQFAGQQLIRYLAVAEKDGLVLVMEYDDDDRPVEVRRYPPGCADPLRIDDRFAPVDAFT